MAGRYNPEIHKRCSIRLKEYDYARCGVGAPLVGALSLESQKEDRAGTRPAPTALGNIVGTFKSISTHQYATHVNENKWPAFPGKLWQRNYYDRIIRNDTEMDRIRHYIINNPAQWDKDKNNPAHYTKTDF
jgi:hypothetical protein